MFSRAFTTLTSLAIVACGCTTHLTHEKATSSTSEGGPAEPAYEYYLPQQTYTIEVTYRLKTCPSNNRTEDNKLQIRKEVVVTEESIIDSSEHYYIKYRDLDSVLKTTSFQVSKYPNQTLKGLGASIEDQTGPTLKNILVSGITLAKMAMGLPNNAEMNEEPIPLCNETTLQALRDVQELNRSLRQDNLTQKERAARTDRLGSLGQYLSVKVQETLHPKRGDPKSLSVPIELPKAQKEIWFVPNYFDVLTGLKEGEAESAFNAEAKFIVAEVAHGDSPILAERPGRGLVYREPVPASIIVCNASCAPTEPKLIGGASTNVAQLGAYRVVLLDNYPFSKNNVTLAFAPNGMLESMAYGSEASLPKATGVLAESSALGLGFASAIDAAKAKERAERGAAELNSIQTETALLKARADLIEARNRLFALESEANDDVVE